MADWTRRIIKQHSATTWGKFKAQVKVKYSPAELEEKKIALHKLKTLKLKKCETLKDYIDKFIELKDSAGCQEAERVIDYLLRGIYIDLYIPVSLAISQAQMNQAHAAETKILDFAISQFCTVY
ncbi:hypothetical protein MBANPS3_012252 [Mucor bainieri]